MAAQASNLIDLILRLLKDPAALAEFQQNPDAVLAACGATTLDPQDVHDALVLADDKYDDGNDHNKNDSGGHHHHVPPPPRPEHGESEHDAAVRYIKEYVTNNYVDDRDTNIDNSVNQQIHTDGGDVDQVIRTTSSTASGDGAVSAGGDIRDSTITSGDGNQVGDGNIRGDGNVQGEGNDVVSGDHNTTAFGTGAANSADIGHASVSGGGALSVAGDALGDQHNIDSHNVQETTNTTDVGVDDSFNSEQHSETDSNNTSDSHTSTDSHNVDQNHVLSDNHVQDVSPV
jgi:hypothetical protein